MHTNLKEINASHRTNNLPIKIYRDGSTNDHWHDEYEFICADHCPIDITINGAAIHLSPGDAVLVQGRDIHSFRSSGTPTTVIVVHPELWGDAKDGLFWGQLRFQQQFSTDCEEDFEILSLIKRLPLLLEERPYGYDFRIKATLCRIFCIMLDKGMYTESEENFILHKEEIIKLSDYIHKNYAERITLDDLCARSHFSRSYLIRIFKENTGKTPLEYINSYRLFKAASKLHETGESILQISVDCGFPSVGYFIRSFKAQFGMTPGAYRKR